MSEEKTDTSGPSKVVTYIVGDGPSVPSPEAGLTLDCAMGTNEPSAKSINQTIADAMYLVAEKGDLSVVNWLHENRGIGGE